VACCVKPFLDQLIQVYACARKRRPDRDQSYPDVASNLVLLEREAGRTNLQRHKLRWIGHSNRYEQRVAGNREQTIYAPGACHDHRVALEARSNATRVPASIEVNTRSPATVAPPKAGDLNSAFQTRLLVAASIALTSPVPVAGLPNEKVLAV
jgi:hypothetical protein